MILSLIHISSVNPINLGGKAESVMPTMTQMHTQQEAPMRKPEPVVTDEVTLFTDVSFSMLMNGSSLFVTAFVVFSCVVSGAGSLTGVSSLATDSNNPFSLESCLLYTSRCV